MVSFVVCESYLNKLFLFKKKTHNDEHTDKKNQRLGRIINNVKEGKKLRK